MKSGDEVVSALVTYFNSGQWQALLALLTHPQEEIYHVNLQVVSSLEIPSFNRLLERYFQKRGTPLDRRVDILSPDGVDLATPILHFHDVNSPRYTASFAFRWQYNPDCIISAVETSLLGANSNMQISAKAGMDSFLGGFSFKAVGPAEEKLIADYYKSVGWKKLVQYVLDPSVVHCHANLEINFDPWILKMWTMRVLSEIGWKVDYVVPCIYRIPAGERGKVMFLTSYPEKVWDMCWTYNPGCSHQAGHDEIYRAEPLRRRPCLRYFYYR